MLLSGYLKKANLKGTMDLEEARKQWADFRTAQGWKSCTPLLTPPTANAKFAKTLTFVYGLSLAPARGSGVNVCERSTRDCRAGCVAYAGKGMLPMVTNARITKTRFLYEHAEAFVTLLTAEIKAAVDKHGSVGVRLNTFSDLPWEDIAPWLFEIPGVTYFDYTKVWERDATNVGYHLTYSASELTTDEEIVHLVSSGKNVAVVFGVKPKQDLPTEYLGLPVINGDKDDARFLDPLGVIVGLRAKGKMRSPNIQMVRKVAA
jgi:hypothetical protein